MTTRYEYGTKVAEFIKHSDEALQELIAKKEAQYHARSEGLHYDGLAANIDFRRDQPLKQSILDLQEVIKQGYTVIDARNNGFYFHAILRKPAEMIAAELPKLTELAKAEYAELRWAANVTEMTRQVEITIARRAREQAEAKAVAEAKHRADEEAFALADLLRAYAPKTKTKMKQEVAA
ncbi:hypothetical protein [Pseudomonas fluorescens]|uniref:hypothetical protein n=1 Tax=Pseudomonas fluorescens TaxID=294 RepID=UPI0012428E7C|nr:hypothetical protein [Pseudomonas fluorescens]VVM85473.1 hypothetical protein PS639_02493 [Pseudomonas fluorescens]